MGKSSKVTMANHDWRTAYLAPAGVILLALVLRLYQLGAESLWSDEGCSLRDALHLKLMNGYRPAYYLILRGWMELGLDGNESVLRLPAVIFGVAGVGMLYVLGRRLMGGRVALLASLFMAVSVLQINHSQEVRMYSLVVLASLVNTYILVLWRDNGGWRYAPAYAGSALLMFLTFPLTILVLAAHSLYMLLYAKAFRPASLRFLGIQLCALMLCLPWLLNNIRMSRAFRDEAIAVLIKPSLVSGINFFGDFFIWKYSGGSSTIVVGLLVFSLIVLGATVLGLRGFRNAHSELALVWLWIVVPLVGITVLSYNVVNMWMVRYLMAASPAVYLLVARGIFSLRRPHLGGGIVLILLMVTSLRLWMYYENPVRPEWRPAVQYLESNEQPGDVIGIYSAGNELVFGHYYRGNSRWVPLGVYLGTEEQFGKWNEARVQRLLEDLPHTGQRFWLVLSKHTFRGGFSIINYVSKHYQVLEHHKYHDIELLLVKAEVGFRTPRESYEKVGRDTCSLD